MKRYQDTAHDMHRHIVSLTKAGEFAGHQAARTVLLWFAHNIAIKDNAKAGLRRGYVMEGCIHLPVICESTGLSKSTASAAVTWLHERGLIKVRRVFEGQRQRLKAVEITSFDAESEQDRQAWLSQGEVHRAPPAKPQRPKLRLVSDQVR